MRTWGRSGMRCKVRVGVNGAGRVGDLFATFRDERNSTEWAVVHWDDEARPSIYPADDLLRRWRDYGRWENVK